MSTFFSNYVEQSFTDQKVLDARNWFREQAQEVERLDTKKIIKENASKAVSRIQRGHLYLFRYDPKLKESLPYYDVFPIIFVIDKKPDGFLGLNMHYLPYVYRAKLMDALYEFVTGQEDVQKIKTSYKILTSVPKLKYFRPCLKYYLNNNIKSRFLHIDPKEWDTAVFLPLHKFIKATVQTVHRDSLKMVKKYNFKGNISK